MSMKINLGVVGIGTWGKNLIRDFSKYVNIQFSVLGQKQFPMHIINAIPKISSPRNDDVEYYITYQKIYIIYTLTGHQANHRNDDGEKIILLFIFNC